ARRRRRKRRSTRNGPVSALASLRLTLPTRRQRRVRQASPTRHRVPVSRRTRGKRAAAPPPARRDRRRVRAALPGAWAEALGRPAKPVLAVAATGTAGPSQANAGSGSE